MSGLKFVSKELGRISSKSEKGESIDGDLDALIKVADMLVLEQGVIARGGHPFDSSLVRVERQRISATQGSAALYYSHKEISVYDDVIIMGGQGVDIGGWAGRSDEQWTEVVRSLYYKGDQIYNISPLIDVYGAPPDVRIGDDFNAISLVIKDFRVVIEPNDGHATVSVFNVDDDIDSSYPIVMSEAPLGERSEATFISPQLGTVVDDEISVSDTVSEFTVEFKGVDIKFATEDNLQIETNGEIINIPLESPGMSR